MSKKHNRKIQKRKFPWLFLVAGGAFIVLAAFLFARQSGDAGGTPTISVDRQKIDYGDVKFNTNKTFAIQVTNTGDGTLKFKEEPYIEVLEGC